MPEIMRKRTRIMSVVGELIAGRMPEHMRMHLQGNFAAKPVRWIIRKNQAGVTGVLASVTNTFVMAVTPLAQVRGVDARFQFRP